LDAIFDIFFLEAVLNGLLLGGLLALLSLGLNLIFGVIDVVWICYAELIMVGMYTIWWLHSVQGVPLGLAFLAGIAFVAALGALMHHFVIRPVLSAEPINQLLVTGGVLFFLQAVATVIFGVEFRNLGVRLPGVNVGEMSFSMSRMIAFAVAAVAIAATYLFLNRTYMGTAIRAISQDRQIMPLMGVNPSRVYLLTSAMGGGMAGLAACLLVLQYDVHPFVGLSFGPITFMICVMGGLGNMIGGFIAAFIFAEIISIGGLYLDLEWGYVFAFVFFIAMMFVRPEGLLARRS
jgi:branched-chain amino acid transport system permease protein